MTPIPTQTHLLHDALSEPLNGDDLVPFTDALPSLLKPGDLICIKSIHFELVIKQLQLQLLLRFLSAFVVDEWNAICHDLLVQVRLQERVRRHKVRQMHLL